MSETPRPSVIQPLQSVSSSSGANRCTVPPGDAKALAGAVRGLIREQARARALGRAGRRYVQEQLAWPQVAGRWLDALEALS